jgi:hypothetical protein
MDRRKFILLSSIAGAAVGVTGVNCESGQLSSYKVFSTPEILSEICDLKTLQEIGMAYRQQTASESHGDKLVALLSTDITGIPVPPNSDNHFIRALLNKKISQDFQTGNTVIVKGWILAVTEARQCALLYLNNQ